MINLLREDFYRQIAEERLHFAKKYADLKHKLSSSISQMENATFDDDKSSFEKECQKISVQIAHCILNDTKLVSSKKINTDITLKKVLKNIKNQQCKQYNNEIYYAEMSKFEFCTNIANTIIMYILTAELEDISKLFTNSSLFTIEPRYNYLQNTLVNFNLNLVNLNFGSCSKTLNRLPLLYEHFDLDRFWNMLCSFLPTTDEFFKDTIKIDFLTLQNSYHDGFIIIGCDIH